LPDATKKNKHKDGRKKKVPLAREELNMKGVGKH